MSDNEHDDAILAKIDGLASVFNTRFDAVEREHDMTRDWLGRVSSTLDRVTETLSRQINIEARVAHVEAALSDIKLDLAESQEDVAKIKEANVSRGVVSKGVAGFIGAAATAFGMKFLHLGGGN